MKHKSFKHPKHHPHWGLRRRLTFFFAFVALMAVALTTSFTLNAVYSELFPHDLHQGPFWKNGGASDPQFEQARDIFRRVTGRAVLAGFLSFMFAGIAAGIVTRILTRPLLALTDGAKRLEAGERGLRLKVVPSQDELQSLTEAFNNLVKGLEQQEAWRRDLVADIAHDLRTPLSVLRSEIEAMQDGLAKADNSGLDRLHQQVILLSRLVEDLRTLSLAEGGGLHLQLEDVDLNDFLQQTINSFIPRANEANIAIQLHPVPDTRIRIDSKQMTRVLNNLLDNALRYGESPIEVSVRYINQQCVITIRDHGEGISQEALERIFERFYKSDASRTRKENSGGSGLGLSIAKAIVEAHNGILIAKNHPEGGAVLEINLPQGASQV